MPLNTAATLTKSSHKQPTLGVNLLWTLASDSIRSLIFSGLNAPPKELFPRNV